MCETNTKSVFCFLQVCLGERRGEMQRHPEERPCEDTGKRQPSLSQGERLQKNPAETTILDFGLQNCGKMAFPLFKPFRPWYFVVATIAS